MQKNETPNRRGRHSGLGQEGAIRPKVTPKSTIRQRFKRIIVWLAVTGWLPLRLAEKILEIGGLSHE